MRKVYDRVVEDGRVLNGRFKSEPGDKEGAFFIKSPLGSILRIIAGSGKGWRNQGFSGSPWEHVSVGVQDEERNPSWEEMCFVKNLFFSEEECVIQFHPPRADYVNIHPHVLHLWRPTRIEIPMPPLECV